MAQHNLELYVFMNCPYCRRVFRYMDEASIKIPLRDVNADQDAYNTLLKVGGKVQVPCLFIDGKPLYESLDIIDWLKNNVAAEGSPEFEVEPEGEYPEGSACMLPRN